MSELSNELLALKDNLSNVIRGKEEVINQLLVALLADGHVLIEDVPGTGKTTLAKALAVSLTARFSRIQFTPDLLPTDIIGGMVYSAADGSFTFRPGPVHSNIVLVDEINRASPRTQSALLEAMCERQVTIEGETRLLPRPFWVVATQNPIEHNGTYPLPEAQLDRFSMKIALGYPSHESELMLLNDQERVHPLDSVKAVMDTSQLEDLQAKVKEIEVEASVLDYIVRIVGQTRNNDKLRLGVSPRGALDLRRCSQAAAFLAGHDAVRPSDVQKLAVSVLSHRVIVEVKAKHGGLTGEMVIDEIVKSETVPA
ncbi:MAG: MoxR family ATPase [Kiritimatiellae bacterium]|jgi:MoxR-like ATPase|nr:MoxR family ATPase [Kiritimatiellia bacterium]